MCIWFEERIFSMELNFGTKPSLLCTCCVLMAVACTMEKIIKLRLPPRWLYCLNVNGYIHNGDIY